MKLFWSATATIFIYATVALTRPQQVLAQQNREFWFINTSSDETMADYIDAGSISSVTPDVKRAWIWLFHSSTAPKFAGSNFRSLVEVNCKTDQTRSLQLAAYDARGRYQQYWSEDTPELWTYVVPATLGESELKFICADAAVRFLSWTRLGQGVTPEEHAQLVFESTFGAVLDRALREMQTGAPKTTFDPGTAQPLSPGAPPH